MKPERTGAGVIIARSAEGNLDLQGRLTGFGVAAMPVQTIRFAEPATWNELDESIGHIDTYDWLVFTSPRAAAAFAERMKRLGKKAGRRRSQIAAVGSSTAAALRECGFNVGFVPKEYLTSSLGNELPTGQGKRVLLLRADIGDESLVETLNRRGFEVTNVPAYRTEVVPGLIQPEEISDARLVAFASPSEVRGFRARVPAGTFDGVAHRARAVCIGPVTAEAARSAGFRSVVTCEEHTIGALAETIRRLVADD